MEKLVEKQQKLLEEAARRHVLDAVVRITQKGNTPDFTMQQVADEAGMAIGTLYNYFENKNALILYVSRQVLMMHKERCRVAAQGPGPADLRLQRMIMEFIEFGREHVIMFRLFDRIGLHEQVSEEQRDRDANEDIDLMRSLLAEGVTQGVFREMDTLAMAKILFSGMVGALMAQTILKELSPEQLSGELMRLFRA